MIEQPTGGGDLLTTLADIGQRSSVKIETNSKGQAQTKVSVYAGESEAEMERLSLLAIRTYRNTIETLGDRARF